MLIEKVVEEAKMGIAGSIMRTKDRTGLPMFMIELIVESVLSDIKDVKTREMVVNIQKEEAKEDSEDGKDSSNANNTERNGEAEIQTVNESKEIVSEGKPGKCQSAG